MTDFMHLFSDTLVMLVRNLRKYLRVPQLIVFSTIQPVMFLLLFTFVFGGAIKVPGGEHYLNFLLPGILVQTSLFGSMQTGVGLADDLTRGMMDRFRSLPMAHLAVLAGRTLADLCRNVFVIFLMTSIGLLVGFRFATDTLHAFAALALILFFSFAFSWISAAIGLAVKHTETAQVAGFIWIFPLVFASSIFVPPSSMPAWLRAFAEHSPVTLTVNAVRALTRGGATFPVTWQALAWIVGILMVFVPLAVNRYRKSV